MSVTSRVGGKVARLAACRDAEEMGARMSKITCSATGTLGIAFLIAAVSGGASACAAEDESPAEEAAEGGAADGARPLFDALPERLIGPAVECAIGSAIEEEPNDTPAMATSFTELSICGVLETAKDVDYLAFETPAGKKLSVFQAVIDGKVEIALTLGSETFGPGETTKFGAGKYVVRTFTNAGKPASYRIRVQFDAE